MIYNVISSLYGNTDILNEGHLYFTNFISMMEEATVKPIFDFFDSAYPEDIDKEVKKGLNKMIISIKHPYVLIASNFFLEAKASTGGVDVVLRQAFYNGAYGARVIVTFRTLRKERKLCCCTKERESYQRCGLD